MPQSIDAYDSEFRDLPENSITAAQRRWRWELAEERHRGNRSSAPASLPPCLEVILQKPGDAGILLAARRLLLLYESGVLVISDSGLLFGTRVLPEELDHWDAVIRPGDAVCLTDRWFKKIRPQIADSDVHGTGDFLASDSPQRAALYKDSLEWSAFIGDLEEKMERVLYQGCHVVLVNTDGSEPPWLDMTIAPLAIVRMSGLSEKSLADEHAAMPDIEVDDRTGGGAFKNPPVPHSYDWPKRSALLDALLLTDVGGYEPEAGA